MISHPKRDLALINAAGFLRSFGTGLMGVVLGIYLFRSGLSSTTIGLIIAFSKAHTQRCSSAAPTQGGHLRATEFIELAHGLTLSPIGEKSPLHSKPLKCPESGAGDQAKATVEVRRTNQRTSENSGDKNTRRIANPSILIRARNGGRVTVL